MAIICGKVDQTEGQLGAPDAAFAARMLEKMPKNYVEHEVKDSLNRMGALFPMSIFLRQEIDRMQKVITTVSKELIHNDYLMINLTF